MSTITRTTDPKARVSLPKGFANTTVVIEQVGEAELRIRKAKAVAEDELHFAEESAVWLSNRDRDRFLELLDNPPSANKTLRQAAAAAKRSVTRSRSRRNG